VRPNYVTDQALDKFIGQALQEDIGPGDHSSLGAIPSGVETTAKLVMKESGIIAGIELAPIIFRKVDPNLNVDTLCQDGDLLNQGDLVFTVRGKARSILTGERLVLNCLQRMSGIATHTHELKDLIKDTQAEILDTRKTTPNFRLLEKWAVYIGGGKNHRFGLFDMVMLKDNHIDFAGGIGPAIKNTRDYLTNSGLELKIEIETRNLQEVEEVIEVGGVDVIMLDNMAEDEMKEAVGMIDGKFQTEASGGITAKNLRKVAETGVDYISIGALTHSIKSLDMSLKAMK